MEIRNLSLNKPQLRLSIQNAHEATSVWSRGTGKSVDLSWVLHQAAQQMPRCAGTITGRTYKQILTRTLPSTVSGLEKLGYIKDYHYFIGRKPPKAWKWPTPYEAPISYEHFMPFYTGAGFHLVSQDKGGGSSRGLNTDIQLTDETLLIDKEKYDKEVIATNRGNVRYFGNVPFHHGIFHFTSMPYGGESKWITDKGNYYEDDKTDRRALKRKLVALMLKFVDDKDIDHRVHIWNQITAVKKKIRYYKGPNNSFYSEADIFDNIQNIGIEYIEQQRRELTDFIFLVEILNYFPDSVEFGFYPALSEQVHGHYDTFRNDYLTSLEYGSDKLKANDCRMDSDCLPTLPLRLAVDWGGKINSMNVCQHYRSTNTLRFLKDFYVKHPKILDDLAREFVSYYQYHPTKRALFAYDHTGNKKEANSQLTYAQQFAAVLKKHKWNVSFITKGAAPTHQEKYLMWDMALKNQDKRIPSIEFNLNNCYATFNSMQKAPAKEGRNGIEKDKRSERDKSGVPQEEATHLSDAADIQLGSIASELLRANPSFTDIITG